MDMSSVTLAIADFPRELFKGKGKKKEGEVSPAATPAEGSQKGSSDAASQSVGDVAGKSTDKLPDSTVSVTSPSDASASASVLGGSTAAGTQSSQTSIRDKSPARPKSAKSPTSPDDKEQGAGGQGMSLEALIGAGEGITRVVSPMAKTPMNVCMSLARGFRNAPKLYSDDTVRPAEKVTDLASGIRIAGKEFGFGLYDGITGLVTQPLRGAEKEGGMGLLKGFGKAIGGVMLKPAAGEFPRWTVAVHWSLSRHDRVTAWPRALYP